MWRGWKDLNTLEPQLHDCGLRGRNEYLLIVKPDVKSDLLGPVATFEGVKEPVEREGCISDMAACPSGGPSDEGLSPS